MPIIPWCEIKELSPAQRKKVDVGAAELIAEEMTLRGTGSDRMASTQKSKRQIFCTSSPTLNTANENGNDEHDKWRSKIQSTPNCWQNRFLDPFAREAEHARIAQELLALDDREDLSPEEEALAAVLTLLIEDYEEKYHPLPRVSPNESLKALVEERGREHKDIWPILGNKGAATEVLSRQRSISKAQAKRLVDFFHVPIDLFKHTFCFVGDPRD